MASLFPASEPLAGWRHVAVTEHRRRCDRAHSVGSLADGRYRDAERIVPVMDRLDPHSPASLYEAFPPAEAERALGGAARDPSHARARLVARHRRDRTERARPPARQCPSHRVAHPDTLRRRIEHGVRQRNAAGSKVAWRFTTADARIKLRSLYPSLDG